MELCSACKKIKSFLHKPMFKMNTSKVISSQAVARIIRAEYFIFLGYKNFIFGAIQLARTINTGRRSYESVGSKHFELFSPYIPACKGWSKNLLFARVHLLNGHFII